MDELWVGKESYACDGQDTDFSLLTFLSNAPVKKLPLKPLEIKVLTRNGYKPSYEQNKFQLQYKFRKGSISLIFKKELLSTFIITFIMVYLNYQYNYLFSSNRYKPFDKVKSDLETTLNN